MILIKWRPDRHLIYHASSQKGKGWIRLCLTKEGDKPDYAEQISGQIKCSSCIRRALESTR